MIYPQFYKRKHGKCNEYFIALREFSIKDTRDGSEAEYVKNIRIGLDLVGLFWGINVSGATIVTGIEWGGWQRITVKEFSRSVINISLNGTFR